MPRGRTRPTLLVAAVLLGLAAPAAQAGRPPARIVFPVVGNVTYTNDFGAPRSGGPHQGNDLMGARHQLLVAAERGRVEKWSRKGRTGLCMLYLYGRSGTTYLYIHLNNDRTQRNDNRGGCANGVAYAPGLRSGQKVRAGQLLGYMGDSGDANGIQPHLHFELHPHGGRAVSPYRWLLRARHVLYAAPSDVSSVWLALRGTVRTTTPRLTVRVTAAYASTKRWTRLVKVVPVDVDADTLIERRVAPGDFAATAMDELAAGDRVRVRTRTASVSLATQLATPGALAARRILYLP
jgi:hypothetical protein